MESEIISVHFSYSGTLKFIGLSCILDGSFTHAWFFCNIINWLFSWIIIRLNNNIQKILVHLCRPYKCWHVLHFIKCKKKSRVNITIDLTRTAFKYCEAIKLTMANSSFPNFNIYSNFVFGNKQLSVISLEVIVLLCSILRQCQPGT